MENNSNNKAVKLKKALPHGGIKEIAKRSETSIYTVSRVIRGGSKNPKVLKAIAEYLNELAQAKMQLDQAIELNLQ